MVVYSSVYRYLPLIQPEFLKLLNNRLFYQQEGYNRLWTRLVPLFVTDVMGGPTWEDIEEDYLNTSPSPAAGLVDTLPLTNAQGALWARDSGWFKLQTEPEETDPFSYFLDKANAFDLWRMYQLAVVLQVERWSSFGQHGGRPRV